MIKLIKCLFAFAAILLINTPELLYSQTAGNNKNNKAEIFFPKKDLMKVGVFYYPEQWPREQWERDLKNIAAFGFEFTHFAEFAWTFLEPEEGKFDFKWLDDAIDLAGKAGLKVILCTPTPALPAWMGQKYPEVYMVGEEGIRRVHGNRENMSLTNPKFREFADRIVTELAKRYGNDNRVIGWQLDNEPQTGYDYSPSAQKAFQEWLKAKYGTIDKLNHAWVGSFWSTRLFSFDQVIIPNQLIYSEDKLSPQALLDFAKFTADMQADFLNRQAEIIKKYANNEQWVTTNFLNVSTSTDPRRVNKLDFATFTIYPVAGRNVLGGDNFRIGNPHRMMEACDYFRPQKGAFGVMELQPGQVNWAGINPQVMPGAIHMWMLHAFGSRASFVCTYRYRHPVGSSEMYHDGIVNLDGLTLSKGGQEFVQVINEMKMLRKEYDANAVMPEILQKRKTAYLWNHENLWDLDIQKQTEQWNTFRHRSIYTSAIKSTGAPMDFIAETDDFSAYPFLVAPAYQLVDEKLVEKWTNYVKNGGNLILSSRTAQKNKEAKFPEAPWHSQILSLIGAKVDFFDMLLPDMEANVEYNKNLYNWNCWADVLTPEGETETLAVYADQFYKGKAAAITRKLGKGTVTYIGVETKDGKMEREIIRTIYKRANAVIEDLPKGVYIEWRDGFFVGVNYSTNEIKLNIPTNSKILVGENPLKPAQAIIWK